MFDREHRFLQCPLFFKSLLIVRTVLYIFFCIEQRKLFIVLALRHIAFLDDIAGNKVDTPCKQSFIYTPKAERTPLTLSGIYGTLFLLILTYQKSANCTSFISNYTTIGPHFQSNIRKNGSNPERVVPVALSKLDLIGKITVDNVVNCLIFRLDEYPVIRRADGKFETFKDKHGFVLGGMPGLRYKEYELHLERGTTLFLYTDGVPEATNAQEEMFGIVYAVQQIM